MKTLLLATLIALASTAVHACTLSPNDIQSLASSPSQLTPEKFSALTPAQQKPICETRAFLNAVDQSGGSINSIQTYSSKYLAPDEKDRVIEASNDYVNKLLAGQGIGLA
jgi:hypothetical protein